MKAILGKKVGMTQIFSETGEIIPVTVIEAGPAVVTQIKTVETDGYYGVQIGFEDKKETRVNKPERDTSPRRAFPQRSTWRSSDRRKARPTSSDRR